VSVYPHCDEDGGGHVGWATPLEVTRREVAVAVGAAFLAIPGSGVSAKELVDAAVSSGARLELIEALQEIPSRRRFEAAADVWDALPGPPSSRGSST
jgi:hypothetical protein